MKAVVFSASAQSPQYCLPALWCARLWRDAGWVPLVLAMGGEGTASEWDETPHGRYVMAGLKAECAAIVGVGKGKDPWLLMPVSSHNPGFHSATICRRLACASDLFKDHDVVALGDADMLPLDVSDISRWDTRDEFHIFGADYFERDRATGWQRYPSCYQVATAQTWREIMGARLMENIGRDTVATMIESKEYCRKVNGEYAPGLVRWDCEPVFQHYLDLWEGRPTRLVLHRRFPRERRLVLGGTFPDPDDPSRVYVEADPIDCHVRDRWRDDGHWRRLMENMPRVRPETTYWMQQTRQEYLAL